MQPVYMQLGLGNKSVKQLLELYQPGRDKNRKLTESNFLNIESKRYVMAL